MFEFLELVINLILQKSDVMYSFINDPQQRIYTVPRLE